MGGVGVKLVSFTVFNSKQEVLWNKNCTTENGERVRTSKITSSKVKKRTSKVQKEHQKSEHRKFPLKGSERRKIRTTTTTYGVVPMDTKACGGLG